MEGSNLIRLECTNNGVQQGPVMEKDKVILFPVSFCSAVSTRVGNQQRTNHADIRAAGMNG